MRKHKRLALAAAAFVILLCGAAWLLRADPVDRVRQLGKQLASKELSPAERTELRSRFRDEIKNLSAQQRKELRADRQKRFAKKIADFFKLPKEQRNESLDRDIDKMQEARGRREERRQQGGNGPGQANRSASNSSIGSSSGTASNNWGAGGGNSFGPGNWANRSAEQREASRQSRLDDSTPEFRGQMAEYRQLLSARMQQRGITGAIWPGR